MKVNARTLPLTIALILLLMACGSAHATLQGQLGILDLNANGGINPATSAPWAAGDTYRFVFASSTGRDATSANIADYNTFIQNAANASPLGLGAVSWKALASTSTVDARDNTSTNVNINGAGESIWLLNGTTKIANDYTDFYNGHTSAEAINVSETGGAPFTGPGANNGNFMSLWTGSDGAGVKKSNVGGGVHGWLGTTIASDGTTNSHGGLWCNCATASQWIDRFNLDNSQSYALYGVSEVLTVFEDGLPSGALQLGSRNLVSVNNGHFNISVVDGKARYDNAGTTDPLVVTQLGDGTVEGYNFIVSRNGVTDPLSYASGGAGLTPDPYDPNPGSGGFSNNSGQDWANVWTISDPDTDPKDFGPALGTNTTFAGHGEVQGTVDISGLESGTLYFPHGTFINQWRLELVMTGPGRPDLTAVDTDTVNGPGTNFGWITDFTFSNPGLLYTTITYTYTNQDLDGSRARFMGVILDGVAPAPIPEPATGALAIVGLVGLALRRRRAAA